MKSEIHIARVILPVLVFVGLVAVFWLIWGTSFGEPFAKAEQPVDPCEVSKDGQSLADVETCADVCLAEKVCGRRSETLKEAGAMAARRVLFESLCERNALNFCEMLGADLVWGTPKNLARGRTLFSVGCRDSQGKRCKLLTVLGEVYQTGKVVETNVPLAAEIFDEACQLGFGEACQNLGALYYDGTYLPRDDDRLLALYAEACRNGYPEACLHIDTFRLLQGMDYLDIKEIGDGVPFDLERGLTRFRESCDADSAMGCQLLGMSIKNQTGETTDEVFDVLLKTCELDARNCEVLAILVSEAVATHTQLPETLLDAALSAFGAGCTAGETEACAGLGFAQMLSNPTVFDVELAFEMMKRACDSKSTAGCFLYAIAHSEGLGVEPNADLAAQIILDACANGVEKACIESLEQWGR